MNKKIPFTIFVSLMFSSHLIFAQNSEKEFPKFGVGVSLFSLTQYLYEYDYEPSSSFYLTFNVKEKLRFELEYGFVSSKNYEQITWGIGTFGRVPYTNYNILYGLRFGSTTKEVGSIKTGTGFLAPAVGGEYYFLKHFSLGSEVQLRLVIGNNSSVFTNSNVIVRFYF